MIQAVSTDQKEMAPSQSRVSPPATEDTKRLSSSRSDDGRGLLDAGRVAEAIKDRWQSGETPSLSAALETHPELRRCRTIVLDLAYQEYVYRRESGEDIDAETFSERFPSYQKSLCLFIEVRGLLSRDPEYADVPGVASWPEPGANSCSSI